LRPGDSGGASNGYLSIGGSLTVNAGSQVQLGLTESFKVDPSFNWYLGSALDYLTTGAGTQIASQTVYDSYWGSSSITTLGTDFNYDTIKIGGSLTMDSSGSSNYPTVFVTDGGLNPGVTYTYGSIFKLLDWNNVGYLTQGANSGSFGANATDLVLPGLAAGYSWDTTAFSTFGVVVVIPEPGRMMLMFFGLAALFLRRRRNR
ncbi:MAG: PEP-CTERM sorting domain-containing protein, partial [Verrucomicrobia bacterium]|nr:PEP-CTERM sorting domain-containing protein [Verrucomicrobiota bacterium]